ncbi:proteinase-activated receptor 4 isoform X2 [Octodon degus]|uniref:Proteinase-activated receptor 4 n=1 Tax=Octodon degus TaxID=10160 RepID=A0A6P6DTT1_OCTDE|nr:proteinase-activated receptor 4 isoform X2 [Octodon degus]
MWRALLWLLGLGLSLVGSNPTPSIYDEDYASTLAPWARLEAARTPQQAAPRSFPGQAYANDSDALVLTDSSQALLLGWVPTQLVPALYVLALAVGLPANALALWVLVVRGPRLPATTLLMNLAAADLLLGLALPPRLAYHLRGQHWPFGEVACRLSTAALYGHMYGAVLLLAAISLDRYLALVHPLRARALRGHRLATGLCVGAWLVATALATPLALQRQTFRLAGSDHLLCHDALPLATQASFWQPAFVCLAVLGCFLPLLLMVLCHGATLYALAASGWRHSHALRLTALVLASAVAFFVPSNTLLLLHYSDPSPGRWGDLYGTYIPSLALSTLNSCVDPFLYYYASPEFRDKVQGQLCRWLTAGTTSQGSQEVGGPGTGSSQL